MPTDINDIIRRLRVSVEQSNMSYLELEKKTGIAKSSLQRYCSGNTKKIPIDAVEAIAEAVGVEAQYIMGWEDNKPQNDNLAKKNTDLLPYNPTHRIPVLGYISAGLPLYADEHIEGYTYTELNHGGEYFALRVKGDSMTAARIFEGDIVIVKKQDIVENGEIAIVLVDDEEATVKNFNQKDNIVTLTPQSFNPTHKVQIYDLKNTRIRILGKVVRVQYDL